MEFAASWNPLRKSNTSAAMIAPIASCPIIKSLRVFENDVLYRISYIKTPVRRLFQCFIDIFHFYYIDDIGCFKQFSDCFSVYFVSMMLYLAYLTTMLDYRFVSFHL